MVRAGPQLMKTTGAGPSRPVPWDPSFEDQKHYPHFDAPLRLSEIRRIVNDPKRVASNAFYPLIQYEKKWQPFRKPKGKASGTGKTQRPSKKSRLIRYAARRDAYIFARYRRILSPLYEREIEKRDIADVPIAYRKIQGPTGKGKCNIEFAKDVFDTIASLNDCYVITLDIARFFESLDHQRIRELWESLLDVGTLPADHEAVYKALTDYRWVDRTEAYRRLGHFGEKLTDKGEKIEGYLTPFASMPKQLCTPAEFREKIAGKGKKPSIIKSNPHQHGIPQGTPISDLIANLYMMEFDRHIKDLAVKFGGRAYRYSDDILLVVQADSDEAALEIEKDVRSTISRFGGELKIKEEKSSVHHFYPDGVDQSFRRVAGKGVNGLEYLGFRFDGKRVFIRDSTLSNLKRKMTFSGKIRANKHKKRYSDRTPDELIQSFNFDDFFQSFMRVEDFDAASSVRQWTFWTYARRAVHAFGQRGKPIDRQLKFLKPDGRRLIETELRS